MKIAFLGTPDFAAIILRALAKTAYRPSLVITEPARPVGREQILTPPPVQLAADQLGIPIKQPTTKQMLLAILTDEQPELAIVAAYGRILTSDMLATTQRGFLNVHPSLLPKYRGATPIQAALLAGDMHTGVTIMLLDEGMDTGPILATVSVTINQDETLLPLTDRLARAGGQLLIETLPGFLAGSIRPAPQPQTGISVTKILTKESGRFDGSQTPEQVLNMLRAYTPWPGVWFELGGQRILLLSAKIQNGRLIPTQIQLAGKHAVAWETFARDRHALAAKVLDFLNGK